MSYNLSQLSLWAHELVACLLVIMIVRLSYAIWRVYQQKRQLKSNAPLESVASCSLQEQKCQLLGWTERFFYVSLFFILAGLGLASFLTHGHSYWLIATFLCVWLSWAIATRIRLYNQATLGVSLVMLLVMFLIFIIIFLDTWLMP